MKTKLILTTILLLASALRFYHLNAMPALNADEAAIGYNAYSLIQTGQDEHEASWPLVFKSFGDYKPGLYFYLVLPFVKILGLTELAVRLPSAILGITSVWFIYLLTKQLFPSTHPKEMPGVSPQERPGLSDTQKAGPFLHRLVPLTAAFLLAINPWHIHFSRGGWETNIATFFLLLGTYLFLKSSKKPPYVIFALLSFIFSLYSYHSMRLVAPLLGLTSVILFRNQLLKPPRLKWTFISAITGAVLMIPFILLFLSSAGASRFSGVSIFADTGPTWRVNQLRSEHPDFTSLTAKILHNKPVTYSLKFAQNYLDHFWGEFLFLTGDEIQRNKVPETGLLYIFQFPLILIGIFQILRHPNTSIRNLIIAWLLIAPLPAALTFQSPHALRAHNMIIPLTLLSTLGATTILNWILSINLIHRYPDKLISSNKFLSNITKIIALSAIIFIPLWEFSRYLHQYYSHLAKTYPYSSQHGFKELASWIKDNYQAYPEFVITDRYDQPYILTLFYLQYPPEKFQQQVKLTPRDKFGFSTVRHFDKFYFEEINFPQTRQDHPQAVIAGTPEEIPPQAPILTTIPFPSGEPTFIIASP